MKSKLSWIGWLPLGATAAILTAVYVAWLAAYAQLGRTPLPSLDDPKAVGGVSTALFHGATWTILGALAVWIIGMLASLVITTLPGTANRAGWLGKVVMGLAGAAVVLVMAKHSPGDACNWFLD